MEIKLIWIVNQLFVMIKLVKLKSSNLLILLVKISIVIQLKIYCGTLETIFLTAGMIWDLFMIGLIY